MSNPALSPRIFSQAGLGAAQPMTLQGTVNKSAILLALVLLPGIYTYSNPSVSMPWVILGAIGGFILAIVTSFKPVWAPFTAPAYAVCEGLFLGAISALYNAQYHGIVLQAILLTVATLVGLLGAYKMGIIRATDKFKAGVVAATGGICLVYVISFVLTLFHVHVPFIYGNGMFGIGFSIFVVIIAALNLVLDFDMIEQGCAQRAPQYMEWYGGFALLVTLVWLYLEILRLLSKLARRD